MSTANSKPAFLIIPGSYSAASFYDETVKYLTQSGYVALVHDLPTASRKPPQTPATLPEDITFFHDKILDLIQAHGDVVVVGHSYGGVVATGAVIGLSKSERNVKGLKGGVVRLVYLTAVTGSKGQNMNELLGALGGMDGLFIPVKEDERYGTHVAEVSAPLAFSDLPLEEGLRWVKSMPYQSLQSFADPIEYDTPQDIPLSYIFCTEDVVLTPDYQRGRIAQLERESGRKVDVLELHTGHIPNASNPQETARVIAKAITA